MKRLERKIGETFEYQGHKLKVMKGVDGCTGCHFKEYKCRNNSIIGECISHLRNDKKGVIFVDIKDELEEQPQEEQQEAEEQPQEEQPQELNLCEVLKDCPKGTILWSDNYGEVRFLRINIKCETPIEVKRTDGCIAYYTKEGWHSIRFPANCLLWPSRDCHDWSKFTAPWYKKEKFDPKTLQPFDKVLVRDDYKEHWLCGFFSHIVDGIHIYKYTTIGSTYKYCIPYNDETKHLLGTKDEAPDFYRYWEE